MFFIFTFLLIIRIIRSASCKAMKYFFLQSQTLSIPKRLNIFEPTICFLIMFSFHKSRLTNLYESCELYKRKIFASLFNFRFARGILSVDFTISIVNTIS